MKGATLIAPRRGAVAMEFVVTLPIYLAFAFGIFELSDAISARLDGTVESRRDKLRMAAEAAAEEFSRDEEGFEELVRALERPEYIRDGELEGYSG